MTFAKYFKTKCFHLKCLALIEFAITMFQFSSKHKLLMVICIYVKIC